MSVVESLSMQPEKTTRRDTVSMMLPHFPELPVSVPSVSQAVVDLCGSWAYQQPVIDRFAKVPLPAQEYLNVPGEVVMQGLAFDQSEGIALERDVAIPCDWEGHAIRMRFEAVYSTCEVWIDGQPVAQHTGGFTPFDVDITSFATPGQSLRLTLHVENNSIADLIAHGTRYADHPLIGISRKAFVYALPSTHILGLGVMTLFPDGDYERALLRLNLDVSKTADLDVSLIDPDGREMRLDKATVSDRGIADFDVKEPQLWDTETPRLYTLKLDFGGTRYERKFGFREFVIKDRRPHLNGQPIFLRGVNHHEVHPTTGRADTARWAETDVRLFRDANVNLIRTSHYPPTTELAAACDAHGMLLEVEAPVCFAFGQFDYMPQWDKLSEQKREAISDYIEAASLEMVAFYRSHPSVVIWSVANESYWAPPFARASKAIRSADPTRPQTFNWWKLDKACRDYVEIANHHYPDAGKVSDFADEPRSIQFDEFAHLYCYNDRELATDPGLRHLWGDFLARQWEEIVALPNGAGGSIWAAIDDWFAVPQLEGGVQWCGYGEWGPIDGWRRCKPEYDEMKRAFDPLRVTMMARVGGDMLDVEIENRFDFADLKEVELTWRCGAQSGLASAQGGPMGRASLELPAPMTGERLELKALLPRLGYERVFHHAGAVVAVDQESVTLSSFTKKDNQVSSGDWTIAASPEGFAFSHRGKLKGSMSLALIPRDFSRRQSVKSADDMVPLNNSVGPWTFESVIVQDGRCILSGHYDVAEGHFALVARTDGSLVLSYDFQLSDAIDPFQMGIQIVAESHLETLEWRSGKPCARDQSNPARGSGRAFAWRDRQLGADQQRAIAPSWPWAHDQTAFGTNDFCSTKRNVQWASLCSELGDGLSVANAEGMHVRAQSKPDATHLYALSFSGQGSEFFHSSFVEPVKRADGDHVTGSFVLTAINQPEDAPWPSL